MKYIFFIIALVVQVNIFSKSQCSIKKKQCSINKEQCSIKKKQCSIKKKQCSIKKKQCSIKKGYSCHNKLYARELYLGTSNEHKGDLKQIYTDNGFKDPAENMFVIGFKGYKKKRKNRIGFAGYGSFSNNVKDGNYKANYGFGYGGLYFGRPLQISKNFSMVPGAVMGIGGESISILSKSDKDGIVANMLLVFRPEVSFEYQFSHHFKIGLSASYLLSLNIKEKIIGDELAFNSSINKLNIGLNFIFGKFY